MKISRNYIKWLADLKQKIISARLKAAQGFSQTLMELYWDIGKEIVKKQSESSWGDGLVERLAVDLKKDFSGMKGFSRRNLYAIRQWYLFYSSRFVFVPQPVAQIPWGHNRVILAKVRKVDAALAYASAALQNGWSRDVLELGKGFAFVGRQYRLEISGNEYFIDLLFYHLDLRCYVVIELKAGRFKPEYAGKLNFYLSAVDSLLKRPDDNPSIGLILCRYKDKIEVEYSLRDIKKPMGISNYILTQRIRGKLSSKLPTVEEMENELEPKLPLEKNKK